MEIEKIGNFQLGDIISVDNATYIISKEHDGPSSLDDYKLCSLDGIGGIDDSYIKYDLINECLIKAKLLCRYICDDTIKSSQTLFKRNENGEILFEKVLKYPQNVYSHCDKCLSAKYLNSLESAKHIYEAYYPDSGTLCDLLHDHGHFSYLDKATPEDISILLSSGMLSDTEGAQLLNEYSLLPIKKIKLLDNL